MASHYSLQSLQIALHMMVSFLENEGYVLCYWRYGNSGIMGLVTICPILCIAFDDADLQLASERVLVRT